MGASKTYRTVNVPDLTGGLNDTVAETAVPLRQSPRIENFDLDKGSLSTTRGAIKFNNQTAPRSAVRCKPDPALSPLTFKQGMSVPLRGYIACPYNFDYDIGGQFAYEGDFALGSETFHNRVGRSFEFNITFQVPPEERLYAAQSRGANAVAVGSEVAGSNPPHGFDEALDECTIIVQKGGDRTAPMSWALGIVNVGDGTGLASLPTDRVSNYALVFMWLDAPQCGESGPPQMRYTLTSGAAPSSGDYSTQAYRAILIHKYVEPGVRYSVAVQLSLDTGSPGTASTNTAWNTDGYFQVFVRDEHGSTATYGQVDSTATTSGIEVYKGPADSISYLTHYGIRYSGRDMMFLGLGMRSFPWQKPGFLPYGSDCTPLENYGFKMADRSALTTTTMYGGGVHTLTVAHTSGDAFVRMNHRYGSSGNTNGGLSPYAVGGPGGYTPWTGLQYNPDSLRHYRLIATADFNGSGTRPTAFRGGVVDILSYNESGGTFNLTVTNGATAANFGTWDATSMLVQCFRWHQRPIDVCEFRIWSAPRAYGGLLSLSASATLDSYRRQYDIDHSIELDDDTNFDLGTLLYYLRCDDSEGTVLRDSVVGGIRNAHMAPFGLGVTDGGLEGSNLVFLSGEGEAPSIDLSENPVFMREVGKMLGGTSQGFAMELSCVFLEAYYAIQDNTITLPDRSTTGVAITGSRPQFVPEIMSWDVKDPTDTGFASTPRPLITLTHRGALAGTNSVPFRFPMGFSVEVAHRTDNENFDAIVPSDLQPFYLDGSNANVNRYAYDAPWVGKNVTIQVGIQTTGTADQYDVYIAMSPKDAFLPAAGDPGGAEFAYWTAGGTTYSSSADYQGYFSAAHLTIRKKDLVRSVITLGRWNCGTLGYAELQPRMLVDKLRIFGTAAPGALPTLNGGILTNNDGKIRGATALPQRELDTDDILRPVGRGSFSIDVVDGSATVTPHGSAQFFTADAKTTIDAVNGTYLFVQGDTSRVRKQGTVAAEQEDFYGVTAVGATGGSITLATPYADATRYNAHGASLRLLAYTAFSDDIRDKPLSLGAGKAFAPGTTTVSDVVLTSDLWENKAPITGNWKLRIYSPFGRTSLFQIMPEWVRGLVRQRKNPIRGISSHNDKLYAGVKGSVFEADDRWREDGPTEDLLTSLAFRSRFADPRMSMPEAYDRLTFQSPYAYATSSDSTVVYLDAWVKLDDTEGYRTIQWVGDPTTNPYLTAGSSGHKFHLAVRLNDGRPEFVVGSTAFYTSTTVAPRGLFIATGASPISKDKWTHIRWAIATRATGTIMLRPWLLVNGRKMSVSVNATDNNASITGAYDWLRVSTLVSSGASGRTLVGVSHDAYTSKDAASADLGVRPANMHGFMHSLGGRVARVMVSREAAWTGASTGTAPPEFDPADVAYAGTALFNILGSAEGVGHKVLDSAMSEYGTIVSHPFVSVWHELGSQDQHVSFAEYGTRLFAVSGAKPALVQVTGAVQAGVPSPTTEPSFRMERFPIWKPNVRSTSAESAGNDPIAGAVAGSATQINHYDNHGNNYWRQVDTSSGALGNAEILWSKNAAGTRVFAFKAYIKPRRVDGRIVLWAQRDNVNSGGPFVEIRDGRLFFGWFDTALKKEVTIDSGSACVVAGQWNYVYVRKEWPAANPYGNWDNSYFGNGKIRRVTVSANAAATLVAGTTITDSAAHTGLIIYSSSIVGGAGAYAANTLKSIDYVKTSASECIAGSATDGAGGSYTIVAPIRPTHDSMIVRHFGTSITDYTDQSRMDPLLAKVGVMVLLTIAAGTQAAAGDTLTGASGGVAKVLWAHTKGAVTATVQNVCVYFTSGTSFTGNVSGGGVVTSTAAAPTTYRDCISMVADDRVLATGGASGWVSRAFTGAAFTGAAGGVVTLTSATGGTAMAFHPGMVGMYWMWGSVGGGTASMRGKLYRITSVSENGLQINTVIAGTTSTDTFVGFANAEGGVFIGNALRKSDGFDTAKAPDSQATDVRSFGHDDAAGETSGISPFDGEWASPGWTTVQATTTTNGPENFKPFEDVNNGLGGGATVDPIQTGTDSFSYPIFALGEPGRLRFDTWVASPQGGTWYCPNDGQNYAGSSNSTSSQPGLATTPAADAGNLVVPPSTTTIVCSVNAPSARIQYLQDSAPFSGQRFIRYTFYDAAQDLESNPSPALAVVASAEDRGNATAQIRYIIGSLGVPRRAGDYEVRVYMGLAGSTEVALFRVATVPAGTSEVAVMLPESVIGTMPPMPITNGEPPRCDLVASDGERVYYGALETDKTAGMFSGIGTPASIDTVSQPPAIFIMSGGRGTSITAMTQMDEQVLIAKQGCIGTLTVVDEVAVIKFVSRALGCVAPGSVQSRDNRMYFLAERGVALMTRWGNTNLSVPVYVSGNVQGLYTEDMDRRYDSLVSGAVNDRRGQYVHTARMVGDKGFRNRISVLFAGEHGGSQTTPNSVFSDDSHSFVVCDGLAVSAMGNAPSGSGPQPLVAGTEDGFMVWMDRPDTQLMGLGEATSLYGTHAPVSGSGTHTTTHVTCANGTILDTSLEGLRGTILRYTDVAGVVRDVRILFAFLTTVTFEEVAEAAPSAVRDMTIGAQVHHWESGWLDLGDPQWRKNITYLDLVARQEATGSLYAEFFHDFDTATTIAQTTVDLSLAHKQVSTSSLEGRWIKAVVRSVPLTDKAVASISQMVWRLQDIDQD